MDLQFILPPPLSRTPSPMSAPPNMFIRESSPIIVRDPVYHFEDGDFYLQLRGTLFCLHNSVFVDPSPYIRRHILHANTEGLPQLGSVSYRPLILHGISSTMFMYFIGYLYDPLGFCANRNAWNHVKNTARELEFDDVFLVASHQVHRCDELRARADSLVLHPARRHVSTRDDLASQIRVFFRERYSTDDICDASERIASRLERG